MHFVANVEANQQRSNGLDDARVFELSAIESADAGDFCGEFASNAFGLLVVAAYEDVTIDGAFFREQFGAEIVKRCGKGDGSGDQFTSLLRGGTLPNTQHARWRAADRRGERYSRIDENLSRLPVRLQLFQKRCVGREGNGQYNDFALLDRGRVFGAVDFGCRIKACAHNLRSLLGAVRIARTDDDVLTGGRPARCESRTFGPCATDNSNFSAQGVSVLSYKSQVLSKSQKRKTCLASFQFSSLEFSISSLVKVLGFFWMAAKQPEARLCSMARIRA